MSVPVYCGGQGGQTENQSGQRKNFSALRAEFYQTNVCPPWPETLPASLFNTRCNLSVIVFGAALDFLKN